MALNKQSYPLLFDKGLDTKSDPYQVPLSNFIVLENTVFERSKGLLKRNGYLALTELPEGVEASVLTTFNGNLVAIGDSLYSYGLQSNQWANMGKLRPLQLSAQPVARSSYSLAQPDTAIATNGMAVTVYLDGDGLFKYVLMDSTTGQSIMAPVDMPADVTYVRTFVLGNYFMVVFLREITATPHLQFIAIPLTNPSNPSAATDISTQVSSDQAGFDGVVANNSLFIAWDGNDVGGAFRVASINTSLTVTGSTAIAGYSASLMSVTADITGSTPVIYISGFDGAINETWVTAVNQQRVTVLAPVQATSTDVLTQLTSTATGMVLTLFYEIDNDYSYAAIRSDYIASITVSQAGVVGTQSEVARSVGLASKAFRFDGLNYMLAAYNGSYQPSYFLIDEFGDVVARLAYSNGGGYVEGQVLPNVSLNGNVAHMAYLYKANQTPVNKEVNATQVAGIYSQLGVNVVSFDFTQRAVSTAEIGRNLHVAGGMLWMYDGVKPVEHGFNVFPEDIVTAQSGATGAMTPNTYYYQVVYEWTDGQGNIHRSAPSVPVQVVVDGGHTAAQLDIPTLRLTYKQAPNGVRITIYRWSTSQQTFYQVTSINAPTLNDPTTDSIVYIDLLADSAILGNLIIYTNGGVVENIPSPAVKNVSLYKSRLVLIDAESSTGVWYSKQVIPNTPVELSDLFVLYVPPTTGAQGSTGVLQCIAPLDDKLILTKQDAVYYIVGDGPGDTGLPVNGFSEPVFITATVGTSNQQSIAFIPSGLSFQSDKGIWLLGRDLSTNYIGAPVEIYNDQAVTSAYAIPATNQIRFTLSAVSSTLYEGKHTYLTTTNAIYQEQAGLYTDFSGGGTTLMYDYYYGQWGTFNHKSQVTLKFTTAWANLASLQGFERAYYFYLLGTYFSPHKLSVSIAYDYNPSPTQTTVITPDNFAGVYGSDPLYGGSAFFGGQDNVEQWRVFFQRQKCQSFQLTVAESFDPSYDTQPGQGLSMSGLNIVVGTKSDRPRLKPVRSVG